MNENTENQNQSLPTAPDDNLLNSGSQFTIGMYLKEHEMYDILLRLKIYVEGKFQTEEVENVPPQ